MAVATVTERERQVAGPNERQERGAKHATRCRDREQLLFRRVRVCICANDRRRKDDACVADRQSQRPRERCPARARANDCDEVGIEHGRDDDGRIARVREVVHRPRPHLPRADTRLQCAVAHGRLRAVTRRRLQRRRCLARCRAGRRRSARRTNDEPSAARRRMPWRRTRAPNRAAS